MSRHSVYLSDSDDKILEEAKSKFGSISKVIHVSLNKFKDEQMKEYYLNKSEGNSVIFFPSSFLLIVKIESV